MVCRRLSSLLLPVLLASGLSDPRLVAAPVTGHPRLWLRAEDLPRLRARAVDSNLLWRDALLPLAMSARADMDAGLVPAQDSGNWTYTEYPSEMYAELFAFLSLVDPDASARGDWAQRARTCLMRVVDAALPGPSPGVPFRDPGFAVNDRSRWHGEGFGLTVDWIYPVLAADDKSKIRTLFLRWIDEDLHAAITAHDHPEPVGVVDDPVLTADRTQRRWAANNYFTAHARNVGLMAMALDPADDPGGTLRSYVGNATGAWLYVFDHALRNDFGGGLLPEGCEYAPQTLGYAAQLLFALETAGENDAAARGPQARFAGNPFWDELVSASLHSISPSTGATADGGTGYVPAWYGDGLRYAVPDQIGVFGPLGLHDAAAGNASRLAAVRWFETHAPAGGAASLTERARDGNFFVNAVLYFLLFDPGAAAPADPRPSLPKDHLAPGLGRLLSRTGWDASSSWFTYKLSFNQVDHQNGDGNQIELWRKGEWLTKERTGYDLDYGGSNNHNTLCLENDPPEHNDPGAYRNVQWLLGSQWGYVSTGDPRVVATSLSDGWAHVSGDATNLYDSESEGATDVVHASRSVVWLKPDHVVVYDRAETRKSGRFKRFYLNLPAPATVAGGRATVTTAGGQRLFVTSLLPPGAAIASETSDVRGGDVAAGETMTHRLRVDAPLAPARTRFLHVLQGADASGTADPATLVESRSGTPFAGAVVNGTAVLFPVDLAAPFTSTSYEVPPGTAAHRITGLTPNGRYHLSVVPGNGGSLLATLTPGGSSDPAADSGGVLAAGGAAPTACAADARTLCLAGGRFQVRAAYRDYAGSAGTASAVGLTADTGYLWFFAPTNVEVVVKVVGFCGSGPGRYGVYAAGLTDVEVEIDVTDTRDGTAKRYTNPLGTPFLLVRDAAFACP